MGNNVLFVGTVFAFSVGFLAVVVTMVVSQAKSRYGLEADSLAAAALAVLTVGLASWAAWHEAGPLLMLIIAASMAAWGALCWALKKLFQVILARFKVAREGSVKEG